MTAGRTIKSAWVILIFTMGCQPQSDFENRIDSIFRASLKSGEPGGAILILKGDRVLFSRQYGVADLDTQTKITSETLFNTGSISKTFVAYTILILAKEGKLSLQDSLAKYFSDYKNPEIANKVRIEHLLTHTSGLPDNRRQFLDSLFLLTAKDQENFSPIKQADSLVFEPGTRYEYSNPAFNGLALIIEQVTGRKWQEVVKEKIFVPTGMTSSVITDGPFPQTGVAHAYLRKGNSFIEKDYGEEPTFAAAGNGGVWSSVNELASYERAIRNHLFLDAETIANSRTIQSFPDWKDDPPFIGYCWFITEYNGVTIISHTGTQGGFYGDYVSIPDKNLLYVMLCNIPTPQEEKRNQVLAVLQEFNWFD